MIAPGDLREKPILNQNKVANLPEVSSSVEMTQRRGLDLSGQFEIYSNNYDDNKEANISRSDNSAEIEQTRSRQEFSSEFKAVEHGRVSDSRKLADGELAKGANLKDNEIASLVGGENKKFQADYLKEREVKTGGLSPDVPAARRRQRRLLNTAAAWIHQKIVEHSANNNQNGNGNYNNYINGNDDGNNYNCSGPPSEDSNLVQTQQPVTSKVAEQADMVEVRIGEELPITRATISEPSSGFTITSETADRYSNGDSNNNINKGELATNIVIFRRS